MKAKSYLNTLAFKVSCPNQTGGTREQQLLVINGITVTVSAINHDFVSAVIDRVTENRTSLQDFRSWRLLTDAIGDFLNDVEQDFMHRVALRLHDSLQATPGYDADSDSEDSILYRRIPRLMRS